MTWAQLDKYSIGTTAHIICRVNDGSRSCYELWSRDGKLCYGREWWASSVEAQAGLQKLKSLAALLTRSPSGT